MIRLSPSGPFIPLQQLLSGYDACALNALSKFSPIGVAAIGPGPEPTIFARFPVTPQAADLPDKKKFLLVARVSCEFLTPGNSASNLVYYVQKQANALAAPMPTDSHTYEPLVRTVEESEGVVSLVTYKFYYTFAGVAFLAAGDGWAAGVPGEIQFAIAPAGVDQMTCTGGEAWLLEFCGDAPLNAYSPLPT